MRYKVWKKKRRIYKSIRYWIRRLSKQSKIKTIEDSRDETFRSIQTHPESFRLKDFEWQGMITLKFHTCSFSKNDVKGIGSRNRFAFIEDYMNNLRIKFKISDREFIWVASEEFGESGAGHIHVIFSFDYLKGKYREDKIPQIDFSENGRFSQEANESKDFICRKFGMKTKAVDVNWSPQYDSEGLVNYVCKVEFGRGDKLFGWSKFWPKTESLNVA